MATAGSSTAFRFAYSAATASALSGRMAPQDYAGRHADISQSAGQRHNPVRRKHRDGDAGQHRESLDPKSTLADALTGGGSDNVMVAASQSTWSAI